MGRGTVGGAIVVALLAVMPVALAASPATNPSIPGDVGSVLPNPATTDAPVKGPAVSPPASLSNPAADTPRANDVLAAIGGAFGIAARGAAAVAGILAGAGGALWGGLGAMLGKFGEALAALAAFLVGVVVAAGRLLAGAVVAVLTFVAGFLGQAAARVARDPTPLLTPAVGSLTALGLHVLRAPVLSLFSRLEKHELLQSAARQRIFEMIREQPGAHVSQISDRLGLGWGTTVYHLQRLRDAQLLTAREVGNQLCHFLNGDSRSAEEQRALAATKAPKANAMVAYLRLRGPSTQRALGEELGMSSALVSWHAKRLEDLGVVERVRAGRTCVIRLRVPITAGPGPSAAPPIPQSSATAGAPARIVRAAPVQAAPPVPLPA